MTDSLLSWNDHSEKEQSKEFPNDIVFIPSGQVDKFFLCSLLVWSWAFSCTVAVYGTKSLATTSQSKLFHQIKISKSNHAFNTDHELRIHGSTRDDAIR